MILLCAHYVKEKAMTEIFNPVSDVMATASSIVTEASTSCFLQISKDDNQLAFRLICGEDTDEEFRQLTVNLLHEMFSNLLNHEDEVLH